MTPTLKVVKSPLLGGQLQHRIACRSNRRFFVVRPQALAVPDAFG
jgi:hypothetical protein